MPGAGKQAPEVQEQIKELLEAGFDPTTIHRKLKVGRSSIYRMKRCLQQHGTAYMPVELNKKNGRPKVLTAEQELEVRDWLRDPKNRNRYLDDLVWLIHDRFGIVCSTTTMSKLKRKWLRVIESEETGQPIDHATRQMVLETHPHLPILHHTQPPAAQMMQEALPSMEPEQQIDSSLGDQHLQIDPRYHSHSQIDSQIQAHPPQIEPRLQSQHHLDSHLEQQIDSRLQALQPQIDSRLQPMHQIDSQLEQQLQREIASAEPSRV